METSTLKDIMRCNDEDLCEAHGPHAIERACAAIDALETDAQRLRGLRLLLCETDKTLQEFMGVAVDEYMDANGLSDTTQLTPELFDSLIDGLLAAAATARAKVTG